MRILITGANGLLGYDLWQVLSSQHELYGTGRTTPPEFIDRKQFIQTDITNQELTYRLLTKVNPEIVIHLAAISDVDFCERNSELAFQVNSLGTRNVAIACQRFDTALCYVSTDYVFDGKNTPKKGYRETDTPNPINIYGKTKYFGEKYVEHLLNKFYIVRTSWLFGSYRKNFVSYTIDGVKNGKGINVCNDQCGSPTYTHHLSITISKLIEKPLYGIYHLTNTGGGERLEIVEEIFKLLKKSTKIIEKARKELYFAERPRDTRLDNYIWQLDGFEKLPTWQEALKEYISLEFRV